jgi:hypothetical protein
MHQEDVMTSETIEHYSPICGKPVMEPTYNRFGEWCCSEEHAEVYVKEVRAQRVQGAMSRQCRLVSPARDEKGSGDEEEPAPWWSRRPRWFGRRRRGC